MVRGTEKWCPAIEEVAAFLTCSLHVSLYTSIALGMHA